MIKPGPLATSVLRIFALVMTIVLVGHAGQPSVGVETASIQWCEADQDIAIAHVLIRVKFTNDSGAKLILSRLLIPQLDLRVFGPQGESVPPLDEHNLAYGKIGRAPDTERFEILTPGESSFRELTVSFLVSRNTAHPVHSVPIQGRYRILGTLSTWPFWNDTQRAMRTKRLWKQYGNLVTEDVKINLAKVEIHVPEDMKNCASGSDSLSPKASSKCVAFITHKTSGYIVSGWPGSLMH